MFNALRSDELLLGVGRVLRTVARSRGALEEYERSQVLSAYSITRLLAAEQAAAQALLRDTREAVLRELDHEAEQYPQSQRVRAAVMAASDGVQLGDALCELLAGLPPHAEARDRLHALLANMIDREVDALAEARR